MLHFHLSREEGGYFDLVRPNQVLVCPVMQRVVKPKEERGEGEGAITRVIRFASPSFLLFPWAENPKFGWLRFPRRRMEKAPAMKFEDSKFNFVLFFDFCGGGRFDVFCEILASSLPLSIPRGRCS